MPLSLIIVVYILYNCLHPVQTLSPILTNYFCFHPLALENSCFWDVICELARVSNGINLHGYGIMYSAACLAQLPSVWTVVRQQRKGTPSTGDATTVNARKRCPGGRGVYGYWHHLEKRKIIFLSSGIATEKTVSSALQTAPYRNITELSNTQTMFSPS